MATLDQILDQHLAKQKEEAAGGLNLDTYFANRFGATAGTDKVDAVRAATKEKVQNLESFRQALAINQESNQAAVEANKQAWSTRLGLEADGVAGTAVNQAASLYSGGSRLLGNAIALAPSATGFAYEAVIPEAEKQLYGQYQMYKRTNTAIPPEMEAALNRKVSGATEGTSPTDAARYQAEADANPASLTVKQVMERTDSLRGMARKVNDFFDNSTAVQQDRRDALSAELGQDFAARWGKVTQGWDEAKKHQFMAAGGHTIEGIAGLLLGAGEAVVKHPIAATEYITENAPQIALGALGRTGMAAMTSTNVGYAVDNYQQGIENYQKAHLGRLPAEDVRHTMAIQAASLAVAEYVGELNILHAGKMLGGAEKATAEVAATSAKQSIKNTLGAVAHGGIGEAATEGYQTYMEGQVTGKPASAEDIYKGAVIGGVAGAGLSGGLHGIHEALKATPEHAAQRAAEATDHATFNAAAEANDPAPYLDPQSKQYDPSEAVGVLLKHAMGADVTPETKQANLKQGSEIVAQLEEAHAQAQTVAATHTPEGIQEAKDNLAAVQEQLKTVDPTDKAKVTQLNSLVSDLTAEVADRSDSKQAMAARTEASKLERQLNTGRARLEGLTTIAEPQVKPAEVATMVDEAAKPEVADRLINLSMTQPDSITGEQATKLAEDKSNTFTDEQRAHLRAFSAARIAENQLSTQSKVSQEVFYGSAKNVGMAQYRGRIAAAIAANNQNTATRQLEQLQTFATDHASKAQAARQAMQGGMGNQIVKLTNGSGWTVLPKGEKLDKTTMDSNGALTMQSGRLVQDIQKEAKALAATVAEMQSAVKIKFGNTVNPVVQSNPSAKQTTLPGNINSPKNEEESARPELRPEPPAVRTPTLSSNKTQTKQTFEERQAFNAAQEEIVRKANAAYAAKQEAKTAKSEAAQQPAVVSAANPAPVAEAATTEAGVEKKDNISSPAASPASSPASPTLADARGATVPSLASAAATGLKVFEQEHDKAAPYTEQNLIGTQFQQTAGSDTGTLRPLASVTDFLSALKAKTTKVSDFVQQTSEPTAAQRTVLKDFARTAGDWFATITSNLVRGNKGYGYEDMIQFLLNEQGDLEENTKTAIAYAAYSWVAEAASRPSENSPEEINLILGRGEDAIVSTKETNALKYVGTRQNVVANSLGQRVVAALGLKSLASAPRNLQADLEASIGAHAMKLLLDQGILVRTSISGKEMAELTGKESTDSNAKFYFLKLAQTDTGLHPAAEAIYQASKGTQGILDKLFGVEPALKEPGTVPIKSTQKTTRNTDMAIPSELEKMVAKDDAIPSFVRADMYNLVGQIDPEILLKIAGKEEVTEDSVHKARRASLQAKNDGLQRELSRFMDYVGQMGHDVAMYFEHSVWMQQRVGIATNMINPQTSKIHRHMLYRQNWETKIAINDVDVMTNFKLRVAEGLGVKTDKKSQAKALADLTGLLAKPEVKGAVNVLVKSLAGTKDGTLSANEQQVLLAGVKAGGEDMHSLDALMALAQFTQAKKAGESHFTTQMMAEVDGVTNGPMFTNLLLGAANTVGEMYALLNRGGFFQQGNPHTEYNNWRDAPGNFDLYENTALHMTQAVNAAGFDSATMASLYAFTGELADKNGAVQKAGRNIIKTPLTAMVFGSSVKSAVDSMADKFIDSIYAAIEDNAKGAKGALSSTEILAHLDMLGVTLPAGTNLMEHEFNAAQIKTLKGIFSGTLGKAVEATMKQDFEVFISQRTQFNLTAQTTFAVYNAVYSSLREKMINDLMAEGKLAVNKTTGKPIHDLTNAQEKALRKQVEALAPVMHSPMSKESGELKAGLLVAKSDRKLSTSPIYQNTVKFGQPFADNGSKSTAVHGYEVTPTGPGVAMVPVSMHSSDSAVSARANPDGKALNVHDAQGSGVGSILATAQAMNQATWDTMLNYSPAAEVTAALLRTVQGLDAMIQAGTLPDTALTLLASSLVDMAEKQGMSPEGVLQVQAIRAQEMAYKADSMKLDTMATMQAINQYAMEGGAYAVTSDNRASAASLRSALAPSLSADASAALNRVSDKLDAAIKAEVAKREGKTVVPDTEMDPQVKPAGSVAELGKSAIASDPFLVETFSKTPVMGLAEVAAALRVSLKGEFNQRLLSALERATGFDLTVRYVTPQTAPADLLAKGDDKARGWYASSNGEQAIYVLSPEFKYSGLTPELLLHELTHAAVARTIEQAKIDGKGDAYALVKELEELRMTAAKYVVANHLQTQFSAAVENVHELVSWGMSNQEFQTQVLGKFQMASTTGSNALVSGIKSFINKLVGLVFGKQNATMATGMGVLISNVSGLFNAAAQTKDTASKATLVLNQTNTGAAQNNLRDLSTMDIHNALAQMNSGQVVSTGFSAHLQDLLGGIVTKLHGPFGSFKAAIMAQTAQTPEQVYQHALTTGEAPFALDALGAGFAFTHQEAFAAEQVQVTVREAVNGKDGVTSVAYRELAKLYDEVRSKIKVSDFHGANVSPVEIAEAQALHDFIFTVKLDADGKSEYLSRFAALGLAHEGFNTVLASMVSRNANAASAISFNDRLNKIFEQILNWFAGKMTHTKEGMTAETKLTKLVEQLVQIEVKKRMVVQARIQLLTPIEEAVDTLAKGARAKLDAFVRQPYFKQHTNGFVRGGTALLSAYANERTDAVLEGFMRLRDQTIGGQLGIAASLVNEFRGSNTSNLIFHYLLRITKHIEGTRKDIITGTGKIVLGSFANEGDDLNAQHKDAISAVFLRTDMSSLLTHYNMDELAKLVGDPQAVQTEINRFEANLTSKFRRYYVNAAKTLAYYKATGEVRSAHLVMNAGNIARLYGTGYKTQVSEAEAKQAEKIIDPLVSLYALLYSREDHLSKAQEVLKAEAARTDGGNGVEMVLKTHQRLVEQSQKLLFDDAAPLHMKGYTTEIYDPFMDVVTAGVDEGADLVLQGYTQGSALSHDVADPLAEEKHIYYLRDGGMQRRVTGTLSFTGMKAKGTRVHNGNVSPLSYSGQLNASNMAAIGNNKQAAIQDMFTATGFDPSSVKQNHLAPVLNANGDVVNYRYLMSELTKDTLLDRDNRPEKILGAMAGSVFDKVSSKEQNRKVVEALHEQYTYEFASNPAAYLTVGPKSTDPQLREIWQLLPASTKQAVNEIWGTEGMKVRSDLLDINFGYRKVSVADAFTEQAAQRNFVQGMFVEFMTMAFHEKAQLRTRQVEDIWQAVVKATKGNLVVKSWSTMSGNLRSNWSQLLLMGVNPVAIARSHRVAFKGAWAYKKDSELLFNLQHQIEVGHILPGQTKADIEHQIKRLQDSINRNPVKPLIDAGLMPTIVEDVAADDDIYSYKSKFVKGTEKFTSKLNPQVVGLGKFLLMTEDSSAFKVMSYATQISDFLARYTLYEHMTSKKNPMDHEDAIQLASDAFINYDVPTHRMVQYANDSGLVMFTKYYMRIQKMLGKIYKEHPGRVIALLAAERMIGDQPTVIDSGMLHRWGNPLNLGALDYPGSLDSLTTVKLLSSPFRGGGNPAD